MASAVEDLEDLRLVGLGVGRATSSRVSCGRVVFLPVGSPIIPVKSPMRKTTRWPSSWKWRILRKTTVWPRWRSGADGSKPTLTRSGLPLLRERSSFVGELVLLDAGLDALEEELELLGDGRKFGTAADS